jgi:hypothetical protein
VRRTFAVVALLVGVATIGQGQSAWQTEIGIQGGYSRFKPAGTGANDQVDNFDIPGVTNTSNGASYNALFFILPWKNKIALEPSASFSALAGLINQASIGLRADYALGRKAYAAGGALMGYTAGGGSTDYQLGLQAAVGYRLRVTGRLNGRVEANWITTKGTDQIAPANAYSLLFGISTRL